MKNIIIINGKGGSGKDEFIKQVGKYVKCVSYSSVDRIKMAAGYIGWDGSKDEKSRKFLSDLKKLSKEYNNEPVNYIEEKIAQNHIFIQSGGFVFIHVREPDEIKYFKDKYNATTVLIRRQSLNHKNYGNNSDDNVEKYEYDYVINNDKDIEYLNESAKLFVEIIEAKIKKEQKFNSYNIAYSVYISNPYKGLESNTREVEKIFFKLIKEYPHHFFVSPIHAFGFAYDKLDYLTGLEYCLGLLSHCDEIWVFGDYKNSVGCKREIEYAKKNNIKIRYMEDFLND